MIRLKIPATTANLGPGFDSIGMALALYNYVEVTEGTDDGSPLSIRIKPSVPGHRTLEWRRESVGVVPTDESNLIYQTLCHFFQTIGKPVPPLTLTQEDYIPLARGLGSSSACLAAGLLAGNALTGFKLPRREIINMAAQLEGHPDNTTPALTGGAVTVVMTPNGLEYSPIVGNWERRLRLALMIPPFTLSTERARAVLPEQYARQDVVFNASRAALLVAALTNGDFEKLYAALDDRVHQPYRMALIPGMPEIMAEAKAAGAYGVFLSGAGPAMIAMTEDADFIARMTPFMARLEHRWDIGWIEPDTRGAVVETVLEQ